MLTLAAGTKVFLATEPVDLRRGHDGLCSLVKNALGLDPFAAHLYVFVGRRGDRVKILFWDRGGFVIHYKRLEKGRFRWRPKEDSEHAEIDATDLAMLLDGIDVRHVRRPETWQPGTIPMDSRSRL